MFTSGRCLQTVSFSKDWFGKITAFHLQKQPDGAQRAPHPSFRGWVPERSWKQKRSPSLRTSDSLILIRCTCKCEDLLGWSVQWDWKERLLEETEWGSAGRHVPRCAAVVVSCPQHPFPTGKFKRLAQLLLALLRLCTRVRLSCSPVSGAAFFALQ